MRDSSSHQKKRVIDMMTNLMKDLADIGSSIGSEIKVHCRAYCLTYLTYPIDCICITMEREQRMPEEDLVELCQGRYEKFGLY